MPRRPAGPLRRGWRRLRDAEQRSVDRHLARIGPPTATEALAVWERMPDEHRTWARQAANAGKVADAPEHAVVLADLQDQLSRRTTLTVRRYQRQRRRNLDRAAELWPQLTGQSAGS